MLKYVMIMVIDGFNSAAMIFLKSFARAQGQLPNYLTILFQSIRIRALSNRYISPCGCDHVYNNRGAWSGRNISSKMLLAGSDQKSQQTCRFLNWVEQKLFMVVPFFLAPFIYEGSLRKKYVSLSSETNMKLILN